MFLPDRVAIFILLHIANGRSDYILAMGLTLTVLSVCSRTMMGS